MNDKGPEVISPSVALAKIVSKALVEEGILLKDDARKLALNLASGKVKESDWRITIEKALDKEESDE